MFPKRAVSVVEVSVAWLAVLAGCYSCKLGGGALFDHYKGLVILKRRATASSFVLLPWLTDCLGGVMKTLFPNANTDL